MTAPTDTPSPTADEAKTAGWIGALAVGGLLFLLGTVSVRMVVVVLVIAAVVFMHELGHYITAKWTGMKATEFFLGFGPRIFSFRRGETEFGLKPILAGAYVKIIGMTNLEEVDPEDEPRTYRQQSYPRRVLVASAGSLMHFAMALIGLFFLFAVVGEPVIDDGRWRVGEVPATFGDGSEGPAASAGILAGDSIVTIDGVDATDWETFVDVVRANPGETLAVAIDRGGEQLVLDVPIGTAPDEGNGRIGIVLEPVIEHQTYGFVESIGKTFTRFVEMIGQVLNGIWAIFSNVGELIDRVFSPPNDPSANENLETRPLSLVGAVQLGADDDFGRGEQLLLFIGFNMFIGVFNLLPLLPLDGGHIAVATYERFREGRSGRRHMIDIARLMPLTYAVVMFLVFFGLGAIYLDIANPLDF